jgi:periodic tryptophan protein 2
MILGGGNSKHLCLYNVYHKVLVKKFTITENRSLDGVLNKLNSKNINEFGEEDKDDESDAEWDKDEEDLLPGAKKPSKIQRKTKLAVRVKDVKFSPDGKSFACATTEGVLIYSINTSQVFVPFDLDIDVTLENLMSELKKRNYLQAILMSLKFNQIKIMEKTFELVPPSAIPIISSNFPTNYLEKFMSFLAYELQNSTNIELALTWCKNLLKYMDGLRYDGFKDQKYGFIKAIRKALMYYENTLLKISNENLHTLKFLSFEESNDMITEEV